MELYCATSRRWREKNCGLGGTNRTNSAHPEKCPFMNRMREKTSRLPARTGEKEGDKKTLTKKDDQSVERFVGARVFVR
jgi:hypothetical protein